MTRGQHGNYMETGIKSCWNLQLQVPDAHFKSTEVNMELTAAKMELTGVNLELTAANLQPPGT